MGQRALLSMVWAWWTWHATWVWTTGHDECSKAHSRKAHSGGGPPQVAQVCTAHECADSTYARDAVAGSARASWGAPNTPCTRSLCMAGRAASWHTGMSGRGHPHPQVAAFIRAVHPASFRALQNAQLESRLLTESLPNRSLPNRSLLTESSEPATEFTSESSPDSVLESLADATPAPVPRPLHEHLPSCPSQLGPGPGGSPMISGWSHRTPVPATARLATWLQGMHTIISHS